MSTSETPGQAAETEQPSPALARVSRGSLCAGCGGCALLAPEAITMRMTPPGYLRPHQSAPLPAGAEEGIARICPGLGQRVEAGSGKDDPLWGPYRTMHTGNATDPDLRFRASSGGALSAILVHLLETGTVDGVVQTAAAAEPAHANTTVISETVADIHHAAGSRYAPSSPLAGLEAHLDGGRTLAFVGKPCDVAALRALAVKDPRVDRTFPVVLSFFCAGVPSQTGGDRVLEQLETRAEDVVTFRYRGNGWPGRATAVTADGHERSMSYHDSWGGILSSHVQHRCKICADGTGKAADIVCADAWETDDRGYPLFEERPGISLIVARTEAGTRVLAAAEVAGHVETRPFDPAALASMQPGQAGRQRALLARLAGLRLLGRPVPRYRGVHLLENARRCGLRQNVRNFLGIVRRGLTGRIRG